MVYRGGRDSHLDDEYASPFSDDSGLRSGDLDHRGRSDEMVHFVGLDVSVKATSVCVVDDAGKVILEQKVPTDPADIIAILTSLRHRPFRQHPWDERVQGPRCRH